MWVNVDDVYLLARQTGMFWKVSLHQSGIWRVAFTTPQPQQGKEADRAILKWNRPNEIKPGWIPSISIYVPSIRPMHPFPSKLSGHPRTRWFARPADGRKFVFKVLFSNPSFKLRCSESDTLIAQFAKKNKEVVSLLAHEQEMSEWEQGFVRNQMGMFRIHLKAGSIGASVDSRAILISEDSGVPEPQPMLIDIPLGRENLVIDLP